MIAEQYILENDCDDFRTCALRLRGIYGPGEPNMVKQCIVSINQFFSSKKV